MPTFPVLSSRESSQAEARGKPRQCWIPPGLKIVPTVFTPALWVSMQVDTVMGRLSPAMRNMSTGMNQLLRSQLGTLEIFRLEIRLQPCVNILVWIRLEITPRNHLIKTDIAG